MNAQTPTTPAQTATTPAQTATPATPVTGGRRSPLDAFSMTVPSLLGHTLRKFDPRDLWHNPVLLLVWGSSVLATLVAIVEPFVHEQSTSGGTVMPPGFNWTIAIWLWLTLFTANVAEALAEGRGRSETAALRSMREATVAHLVIGYDKAHDAAARAVDLRDVDSPTLKTGDIVVVAEGDIVPADGEVVWGVASVDESVVTGESAPVIRDSGGDRSAVTSGTRVLSDRIVVRVTAPRGATAVDRMIELAEGSHRHKAPNEMALNALIASFSITFVLVSLTLNVIVAPVAPPVSIPILVSLVAILIPTEIAALMSVTGIASMFRLLQQNVLVDSGHALETAGDITTVLLDKTGTITQGNRQAAGFVAIGDTSVTELRRAAVLASSDDPTPEGMSTVALAQAEGVDLDAPLVEAAQSVHFSAQTRLSGLDLPDGGRLRKGAESAVLAWLKDVGSQAPRPVVEELRQVTDGIARTGGTPLVVAVKPADGPGHVLGVIHLKDVVKASVPARIGQLRDLGIRTVMVTGDNPLTAKTIADEAGVDDFLADATPEDKLALIHAEQAEGHFVAMSGDGINDAPALAQADIGVAMNTATAAAKEAANMIILDDDPTKLVEIVEIGRRQMATRGALTTFNIANDVVRYFTLYPMLFVGVFPGLGAMNILRLHSAPSAILSTLIFSVVVIGVLIRLALGGVPYRMTDLGRALSRNLLIFGLGGMLFAAAGIKLIDLVVALFPGY